jgi:radical SAM protein with 4Fe4S-binding SPASM domain
MLEMVKKGGYRPLSGVWELTLRCNMSCLHCGSRAGKSRQDELSIDEHLRVADDLAELGCKMITLSGGEPLLRKEWPLVAARLVSHGVAVNMITNGFAFRKRELDLARRTGLRNVSFSIDGDQPVHDLIRNKKDAYAHAMEAVDLCVKAGYAPAVNTSVMNANLHLLEPMAQTLIDHGVTTWQVQTGFEAGNLADHPELVLDAATYAEVVPRVAELRTKHEGTLAVHAADDMGYFTEEDEFLRPNEDLGNYWLGCQAGLRVIGIEANGNIKGCLSMQSPDFVEGNVREAPLEEIWRRKGAFAYTREFAVDRLGGFCRECEFNEFCRGGCSWNAYLHGKAEGKFANRYCLHRVRELQKRGEKP